MFPIIDLSAELAPLLVGLNVVLVVSSAAVFGAAMAPLFRKWLRNRERPGLGIQRPLLAGHRAH